MKKITNLLRGLSLVVVFALGFSLSAQQLTIVHAETNASNAADVSRIYNGDRGSGWQASDDSDDIYVIVDLGSVKTVGAVHIYWENANAKAYNISFSEDKVTWTNQLDYTDMPAFSRQDVIPVISGVNAQYVKFHGVERGMDYGYHIFEFEVYEQVANELTSLKVFSSVSEVKVGGSIQFEAKGYDSVEREVDITSETIVWNASGEDIDANGLFTAANKGTFTVTATIDAIVGQTEAFVTPISENIVSNKIDASATSGDANAAFDLNKGSRWESAREDDQSIKIEFDEVYSVTDMIISWETANAKDYIIESSIDGVEWNLVINAEDMAEGSRVDSHYDLVGVEGKFFRLTGITRNTGYGLSIWEWEIYGDEKGQGVLVNSAKVADAVYPNPFNSILNIDVANSGVVEVYNLTGQLQYKQEIQAGNNPLDLSALENGVYIVKININGLVKVDRVVKY